MDYRDCAAQHFGLWMVQPEWLREAVSAVQAGTLVAAAPAQSDKDDPGYAMTDDGIAVVSIVGHMTKGQSSFGGASSVMKRRAIRAAASDSGVDGIMLMVDSPGGTVAGTEELADAVSAAAAKKPTHTFASDLMASGAIWVGVQTSHVTANRTADVGSIGVMARLEDISGMADAAGVKVHVIATGPAKGIGTPGLPVTDEHLAIVKERVDELGEEFAQAIARGRKIPIAQAREMVFGEDGGKVFSAKRAVELGLIDGIGSFDSAMAGLRREVREVRSSRESRSTRRNNRIQRLST